MPQVMNQVRSIRNALMLIATAFAVTAAICLNHYKRLHRLDRMDDQQQRPVAGCDR
jgi:hypothetical protein